MIDVTEYFLDMNELERQANDFINYFISHFIKLSVWRYRSCFSLAVTMLHAFVIKGAICYNYIVIDNDRWGRKRSSKEKGEAR